MARIAHEARRCRIGRLTGLLVAAFPLLVAACGGGTKAVQAPPPPPVQQTEYRIGPGDALQVFVWNHPELTVTVPVRPDGLISTPLVENMVVGQALKPQSLPYLANMTVLDVMIAVGGLAEFAAGNRAVILRREGDQQLRIPVRLQDLLNDGDIGANLPMQPGDVLIIPESRF
jgi:polysaccharide export outer membrane protein